MYILNLQNKKEKKLEFVRIVDMLVQEMFMGGGIYDKHFPCKHTNNIILISNYQLCIHPTILTRKISLLWPMWEWTWCKFSGKYIVRLHKVVLEKLYVKLFIFVFIKPITLYNLNFKIKKGETWYGLLV